MSSGVEDTWVTGNWGWSSQPPVGWAQPPPTYSCVKHGVHGDWLQFRWSALAGQSDLYCLRCFADHLQAALPAGGIVVPP